MSNLVELVTRGVAFGTLVVAGTGHLRHGASLRAQLEEQRLVPGPARRVVAAALGPAEVVIGSAGLVATAWPERWADLGQAAAMAAVVLYLAFVVVAAVLWRWRPGAPCGCSTERHPVSAWVVMRALVFAAAAGVAATDDLAGSVAASHVALALVIAAAFGVLLWNIPSAMRPDVPEGAPA